MKLGSVQFMFYVSNMSSQKVYKCIDILAINSCIVNQRYVNKDLRAYKKSKIQL